MKRKILFLALILSLSIAGCGTSERNDNQVNSQKVTVEEESKEKPTAVPTVKLTKEPIAEAAPVQKEAPTEAPATTPEESNKEEVSQIKNPLEYMVFTKSLDVYSISEGKYIRSCLDKGNLSELGGDEFFSFSMCVANDGDTGFAWESAWVVVDNGEPWYWGAGEIPAAGGGRFPIAFVNMAECMNVGEHTVAWYIDGQEVYRDKFEITRDMYWEAVFELPSQEEIADYKNPNNRLAPYVSGWFTLPQETKFSEYSIEFKADYIPTATYCCLGQWTLDYSSLQKEYKEVRTEYDGVHGYGGFQNTVDGMVSILSFWDVYCKDETGKEITIRAKRVYPETTDSSDDFGGEGTGAHCLVPYDWEADHWYRMHVKCVKSQDTGNTMVEQWVCDLETEEWTLLCSYDLGVKDVTFMSSVAIFLEDYLPQYAGEIRSMEVRNVKYLDVKTQNWDTITKAYIGCHKGAPKYEGSYNFGAFQDRFWIITSGVGGDWYDNGKGKAPGDYFLED